MRPESRKPPRTRKSPRNDEAGPARTAARDFAAADLRPASAASGPGRGQVRSAGGEGRMAHFAVKATLFLAALALVGGAWFMHQSAAAARSSITVKLPPAHPATPRPSFAFPG